MDNKKKNAHGTNIYAQLPDEDQQKSQRKCQGKLIKINSQLKQIDVQKLMNIREVNFV